MRTLLHYLGWMFRRDPPDLDNIIQFPPQTTAEVEVHYKGDPSATVSRIVDLSQPIRPQIEELLDELDEKED